MTDGRTDACARSDALCERLLKACFRSNVATFTAIQALSAAMITIILEHAPNADEANGMIDVVSGSLKDAVRAHFKENETGRGGALQ
jgi:hypothetical protein